VSHVYGTHDFNVPGRQLPLASQACAVMVESPEQVGGAHCVPAGTGLHVPALPGRLHAWQALVHAVSQQTPWAQ
jgi:hypothetical protein